MIYYFNDEGLCIGKTITDENAANLQEMIESRMVAIGATVHSITPNEYDIGAIYYDDGIVEYTVGEFADKQIVKAGHKWVPGTGWVDQRSEEDALAAEKALKHAEINAERERRNNLVIAYSGSDFDADLPAQRNLQAWMINIAAGVDVPDGFEWRDHYNVNHAANNAFVVGLGNAITMRGTLLYQVSWVKKAELEALTTIGAVESYDVAAGW
jgi:hypothetical protein